MPKPANILPIPTQTRRLNAKASIPAWAGIFLALFFLLMLAGRSNLLRDPGVFWHTAFGEQILSGAGTPRIDTHSLTHAGESWLDLQWLGECAMAFAYRLGGWDTLLMLGVVALAATYTWLANRFLKIGMHMIAVAVVLVAVLGASSHHFHVRPHLVSVAFLGLTVALLVDFDRGHMRIGRLLWLPVLFTVWANVHGGVLGGLATVAIAIAMWLGLGLLGRETPLPSLRAKVVAITVLFACGLALLITPHGWQGVVTCVNLMRMPLPDVIQEHRPLNLFRVEGVATLLLGIAYIATLKSAGLRNLRATWLLPLPWLILAFLRVRHAPLFAMTWGVVMADMLRYTQLPSKLAEHGLWNEDVAQSAAQPANPHSTLDPQSTEVANNRKGLLTVSVLLALSFMLQATGVPAPVIGRQWADLDNAGWPMELSEDLAALESRFDRPIKVFNQLHFGGFVIFHHPNARVFIDDRCELYGFERLANYSAAETKHPERIRSWHREHQFDVALVAAGSPFDMFMATESGWQVIARSPQAALYEPIALEVPSN